MPRRRGFGNGCSAFGRDEQLPIVLDAAPHLHPADAAGSCSPSSWRDADGAINYNLSLGHALVFLLAGLGLVSMVHTFRNLVGLRITPGRASRSLPATSPASRCIWKTRTGRRAARLSFLRPAHEASRLDIPPGEQRSIAVPCPAHTARTP